MPYLAREGVRLYYEDTASDQPAVLFSHGYLFDTEMFEAQARALQHDLRCILWDQRGFGRTGSVRQPFSYWDSAGDALALLDHLNIPSAVFVGLSQGGFLSMRAALLAPTRVRALVLLSTQAGLDTRQTIAGFEALVEEWERTGAARAGTELVKVLIAAQDLEPHWLAKWRHLSRDALRLPTQALIRRDDITHRLRSIVQPSLVIHGDADRAIELSRGLALANGLAACKQFLVIPGAGHAPPLTHPQEVSAAIKTFLADLGPIASGMGSE